MSEYRYIGVLRRDYPYNEAVDDLTDFFKRQMHDSTALNDMLIFLEECRKDKHIPMRYINLEFSKYLKSHPDRSPLSKSDEEMLDDLMHFWG